MRVSERFCAKPSYQALSGSSRMRSASLIQSPAMRRSSFVTALQTTVLSRGMDGDGDFVKRPTDPRQPQD